MRLMCDMQATTEMARAHLEHGSLVDAHEERRAENALLREELSWKLRVQREAIFAKRARLADWMVAR